METNKERLLPVAAAFVVGLLVGWLAIGWWLLPVRWTNTAPPDLHPTARQQYIAMVAESFAATGNVAQAQERLGYWSREEAARLLAQQARAYEQNGQAEASARLLQLALALDLPLESVDNVPPPAEGAGEGAATGEEAAPAAGRSLGSRLVGICGLILAIPLIVGGVGFLLYLGRQRLAQRRASGGRGAEADDFGVPEAEPAPATAFTSLDAFRPKSHSPERPTAPASHAPRPAAGIAPALKMQEFVATYRLDDTHYDENFPIEDKTGNYRGDCGIGVLDKVPGPSGAANALEVWLFDKHDIHMATKVLMTEEAYGDAALRRKWEPKGDPVLIRPGETFMLQTQSLVAAVEITEVDYANIDPPRSGLARLQVKIRVSEQAENGHG